MCLDSTAHSILSVDKSCIHPYLLSWCLLYGHIHKGRL